MHMTRNTALRGLVWLIVLFVANGTPIGRVLDNTLDAIAGYHLTEAQHFWWSFVILTALVWYMSNIFVALWGKKEEQQESQPRSSRQSTVGMYVGFALVVTVGVILLQVVR
jgi:hypothetical protein